jgi:alpha-ribazole phosphatase
MVYGMTVWLVRHPPIVAAQGLCYGQTDWPTGAAELNNALTSLKNWCPENVAAVYSSPLQRCLKFADALALAKNWPAVQSDADLMEMNFGQWENQAWQQIDVKLIDHWAVNPWGFSPPHGESAQRVLQRWLAFKRCYLSPLLSVGQSGVIVTHAGVIRLALWDAGCIDERALWLHAVPYATPIAL